MLTNVISHCLSVFALVLSVWNLTFLSCRQTARLTSRTRSDKDTYTGHTYFCSNVRLFEHEFAFVFRTMVKLEPRDQISSCTMISKHIVQLYNTTQENVKALLKLFICKPVPLILKVDPNRI